MLNATSPFYSRTMVKFVYGGSLQATDVVKKLVFHPLPASATVVTYNLAVQASLAERRG